MYDRIVGDFSVQSTIYTPQIYGSGRPYTLFLCVLPVNVDRNANRLKMLQVPTPEVARLV